MSGALVHTARVTFNSWSILQVLRIGETTPRLDPLLLITDFTTSSFDDQTLGLTRHGQGLQEESSTPLVFWARSKQVYLWRQL